MGRQMKGEELGEAQCGLMEHWVRLLPPHCPVQHARSAVRLFELFRNIINKDNDNAKNIEIPAMSHNSKSTKKGQDC